MGKYQLDKELDSRELKEINENAKNPLCFIFAKRLRERLIACGISQEELAENANCSPASTAPQSIACITAFDKSLTTKSICSICC